jgi:hypothetical protein
MTPATPNRLAALASSILSGRRQRETIFPTVPFSDPAWDMLLDMYVQHVAKRPISVSSLCSASSVPTTTALRWVGALVEQGLFVREADQRDGRRVLVRLTPDTIASIEIYLKSQLDRLRSNIG